MFVWKKHGNAVTANCKFSKNMPLQMGRPNKNLISVGTENIVGNGAKTSRIMPSITRDAKIVKKQIDFFRKNGCCSLSAATALTMKRVDTNGH